MVFKKILPWLANTTPSGFARHPFYKKGNCAPRTATDTTPPAIAGTPSLVRGISEQNFLWEKYKSTRYKFPFFRRGGFFLPWQKKTKVVLGDDRRWFFESHTFRELLPTIPWSFFAVAKKSTPSTEGEYPSSAYRHTTFFNKMIKQIISQWQNTANKFFLITSAAQ